MAITMASFLSDLKTLQELTDSIRPSKTNLQKAQLICMLIRHQSYKGFKWGVTAGWLDNGYLSEVKSKNPGLFSRLSSPGVVIRDSLGYDMDLPHLAAVIDGYLSVSVIPKDWTGWAGDVGTLTLEVQRDTWNSQDFDLLILTAKTGLADNNSTCSPIDVRSDIDAANIARRFKNSNASIYSIISLYYNAPIRRFTEFIKSFGDDIAFQGHVHSVMNNPLLYKPLTYAVNNAWPGGGPSGTIIYAVAGTFINHMFQLRNKGL